MKNKTKHIVPSFVLVILLSGCATPVETFTPINYSVKETTYKPGKGWYQQPRCYRRGS